MSWPTTRCVAPLIVLLILAAGCLIGSDRTGDGLPERSEVETAKGQPPSTGSVRYDRCSEHIGRFPVAAEELIALLPQGFDPSPHPADPTETKGTVAVLALKCGIVQIGKQEVPGVTDLWVLVPVRPPFEYEDTETDAYVVLLGGIASSEVLASTYQLWGMGQHVVGDMTHETDETAEGRMGSVIAVSELGSLEMRTTVVGREDLADGSTRYRIFGVDTSTRSLTGAMDLRWTDPAGMRGGAVLQVSSDGHPFDVFEPEAETGTGAHYWGVDYAAELSRVDL